MTQRNNDQKKRALILTSSWPSGKSRKQYEHERNLVSTLSERLERNAEKYGWEIFRSYALIKSSEAIRSFFKILIPLMVSEKVDFLYLANLEQLRQNPKQTFKIIKELFEKHGIITLTEDGFTASEESIRKLGDELKQQ